MIKKTSEREGESKRQFIDPRESLQISAFGLVRESDAFQSTAQNPNTPVSTPIIPVFTLIATNNLLTLGEGDL